jgi:outer membrane protein OmpA-like peptidoglycan-associated protein
MSARAKPVHPTALVSSRFDGEVSIGETRFLEEHLRGCPACREREIDLRDLTADLSALPVVDPPPGSLDRLLVSLRTEDEAAVAPAARLQSVAAERPSSGTAAPPTSTPSPSRRMAKPVASGVLGMATVAALALSVARHAPFPGVERGPAVVSSVQRAVVSPTPRVSPRDERLTGDAVMPEPRAEEAPVPAPAVTALAMKAAPPVASEVPAAAPADAPAALQVAEPVQAPQRPEPTALAAFPSIVFRGNDRKLDRSARSSLDEVATWLDRHPGTRVVVRSLVHERRSDRKSAGLGRKRAEAVVRTLGDRGIAPSRLAVETATAPTDEPERVELLAKP